MKRVNLARINKLKSNEIISTAPNSLRSPRSPKVSSKIIVGKELTPLLFLRNINRKLYAKNLL